MPVVTTSRGGSRRTIPAWASWVLYATATIALCVALVDYTDTPSSNRGVRLIALLAAFVLALLGRIVTVTRARRTPRVDTGLDHPRRDLRARRMDP